MVLFGLQDITQDQITAGTCLLIYGLNDADIKIEVGIVLLLSPRLSLEGSMLLLVRVLVIEAYIEHSFIPRKISIY
jgi:hypothetical protein